ncbi:hypothetical protein GIV23_26620 [Pseudomonas sp. PA-1-2A]|nr:hypothetical protein [Pseudomonas sp. PA-1-8C]MCF5787572.1 hypothetical protein [Pseudomonas sp. PA-1-6G]MCF5795552.1 hypothetical protein [Pseudomonas sp. PA-1-6B]MCF5798992.1 hypothetical protein [Pseudomonas sp. PA-1-5A]MCF5816880.1 hypothetical protein [Pseudomonas sp. PA-1-2A]MCF5835858.1 hypothetical protein [Pseudomonas sp. PA-1-6A]MCF8970521.1 hypothetical protein [Pseudomonas carnis]
MSRRNWPRLKRVWPINAKHCPGFARLMAFATLSLQVRVQVQERVVLRASAVFAVPQADRQ